MQLRTIETVSMVHQIRCDRCGKEAERGEVGFQEMTSIGFDAGYDSIFGDGNRVEVDLCEPCLRDTLGAWPRVKTPADTPLATMLAAFKPDRAQINRARMKPKPVIPLLDYLRIFRVIKSVLDSVDAHTTHACMFFSIAGAAILREYYKKDAMQISGAAFLLVDGKQRNAMSFATVSEGQAQSSDAAFHSWVQCDGYVIDFMTPIFPDICVSSGHPFTAPGRMFQKRLSSMALSHGHLHEEGDFFLVPNPELTVDLRRSFLEKPASADLVNICLHWYRRPPKPILPELHMQNDLGEVTKIKLSSVGVSGAW